MTTLIEFLEARLREDQEAAEAAAVGPWHMDESQRIYAEDGSYVTSPWTNGERDDDLHHVVRHHPARVLREVSAKRAILEDIVSAMNGMDLQINGEWGLGPMDPADYESVALLQLLAMPYSDHPDYRKEWAA